QVVLG
ncbi:hypothetical protein D039_2431B, partial [Vibrio parahaemolyticus EKP-028]